ncbi:MAG: hypothetical protein ACOX6F_09095 [Syntrophomonadaceae bacterium]|jgi:uncharacterized membrane protein YkvI|nr:hypothetical protein [Syntrophomonadaceae bacterium]HQD89568.1 hypothetical protein [Syntrophomonadaceae bacterium]
MKHLKVRLMLVMGYLGAVIGAGFASGQEIMQFFVNYGSCGLTGALTATFLFALMGGLLLHLSHRFQVSNYQDLLAKTVGEKLSPVIDTLLAVFLFLGISTMFSASGAVFYEHLYLPKILGIFMAYILVVVFLLAGRKGMIYSYNLLVPIKLILLLAISVYAALFVDGSQAEVYTVYLSGNAQQLWVLSAILYVAYNFALAMVVLTEYQSVSRRRDGIIGAAWGGFLLGLLVVLNYLALSRFLPIITHYQVPMLYVAGQISIYTKYVYTVVLWLGILTTAIANTYGFTQRIAEFSGFSYSWCLIMCSTLALPLSMQDFSLLVGRIYPIFGMLGLIIVIVIIGQAGKDILQRMYYNICQLYWGLRR